MLTDEEIQHLSDQKDAEGNPVAAGWVTFRLHVLSPVFDPCSVDMMRSAFYGGAAFIYQDLAKRLKQTPQNRSEMMQARDELIGRIRQIDRELSDYMDDIDAENGIHPGPRPD